jgi:hypothetical protein
MPFNDAYAANGVKVQTYNNITSDSLPIEFAKVTGTFGTASGWSTWDNVRVWKSD